jgi:mercuric ion transport protein
MANASGIRAARSWPFLGAILAAIAASSCCILPIVGAVLGVSTLGAGAALGGARPLFLLGAGVFVFVGARAVLAGRRQDADACGCEADKPRLFPAVMFVVGAIALVAALAFIPEMLIGGAQ